VTIYKTKSQSFNGKSHIVKSISLTIKMVALFYWNFY